MRRPAACLALAVLLWLSPAAVRALPSWSESRGEDLRIRLVTIGTGGPLYTWWGHTGLIVEDASRNLGRFYNYGLFSFEADNFFLNFASGRLVFAVGASSPAREMELYRAVDRSIRIQTLDLDPEKRREMALFLEENVRPENRNYLYDHYRDNCATRVRDLIDRMTDGRLAALSAGPDGRTFREHTRRHTFRHPLMDWLLMFLMGPSIDRPISRWEAMFLPAELERAVDELTFRDAAGTVRPLVSESGLVYRARGRKEVPASPPRLWPWGLLAGLAAAAAAVLLRARAEARRPAGPALLGLYQAAAGLLFGLLGTALLLMSLFTDHTVTYGNVNLLLASPLALLALPLGLGAAAGRGRWQAWADGLWNVLACLGLAALLGRLLLSRLVPAFGQDNRYALAVILPLLLAFTSPVRAWIRRRLGSGRAGGDVEIRR